MHDTHFPPLFTHDHHRSQLARFVYLFCDELHLRLVLTENTRIVVRHEVRPTGTLDVLRAFPWTLKMHPLEHLRRLLFLALSLS